MSAEDKVIPITDGRRTGPRLSSLTLLSRPTALTIRPNVELLFERKPTALPTRDDIQRFGGGAGRRSIASAGANTDVDRTTEPTSGGTVMPEYYIDDENSVHIPDTTANDRDANTFASLEELIEIAAQWPLRRLVEVWNKLPGVHPVRRFEDRQVAIRRIWRELGGDGGAARQGRRRRRVNKTELVLALLRRPEGATLKALMKATKWQAHSVRGFVSGKITKDLGLAVKSFRRGGERVYALVTTSPSGEA